MTLKDLIEQLLKIYNSRTMDYEVVVPLNVHAIGPRPFTPIVMIHNGFDWDKGKVFLTPESKVIPIVCCHKHNSTIAGLQMILCPECGNKRCPKASDCELECTHSNESGQPGSVYQ